MPLIRAVVFDIYKTLIDIETDEESLDSYLFLSRWLSYHGVDIDAQGLQLRYLEICSEEMSGSADAYPDIEIGNVFSNILLESKQPNLDVESKSREMALLFRILTTRSISVYPGVVELLESLQGKVATGIVSNAQRLFTIPELSKFSLTDYFDAIVLSSDIGVRKPNPKIFQALLEAIDVPPDQALFIGDNIFDDVYGAGTIGMKTIWISRDSRRGHPVISKFVKPDYVFEDGSYDRLSRKVLSLL